MCFLAMSLLGKKHTYETLVLLKKTCKEIACVVEGKTHKRNTHIANARTCKENSNVVEEKNTHKMTCC